MFDLIPFENRNNTMFDTFDRMMNGFWGNEDAFAPCRTDILDQGSSFLLKADMPGFKKEDIHIDIQGGQLNISAEHKEESKEEKKSFVRHERKYGSLCRSFDIEGIQADQITASYNNGVLELVLPKTVQEKPKSLSVEVH